MPTVFKCKPFYEPKSSPHLRIADVLLLQEDQEKALLLMDGSRGSIRHTPRRTGIADCLFSFLKRGKMKMNCRDGKHVEDDVAPSHVTRIPDSLPERCRREADSDVGLGCCLVHLIAESRNELQKLTELRIQMESALQNVRSKLQNKDLPVAKKLESNDGVVVVVEEGLGFNNNLSSNEVVSDQSLECSDAPKEEDCLEGMASKSMGRLEAELEVELERLQFHLDTGEISPKPPQETIEEENTVNSITSGRSYSLSCGEVIDPTIEGEEEEDCCVVPPYELERKLHELLETRQEQQIRELEDALRHARKELREKEREVSWWKDTALIMCRHVNEPSRLNFRPAQHTNQLC